jgi:hypothetical protein
VGCRQLSARRKFLFHPAHQSGGSGIRRDGTFAGSSWRPCSSESTTTRGYLGRLVPAKPLSDDLRATRFIHCRDQAFRFVGSDLSLKEHLQNLAAMFRKAIAFCKLFVGNILPISLYFRIPYGPQLRSSARKFSVPNILRSAILTERYGPDAEPWGHPISSNQLTSLQLKPRLEVVLCKAHPEMGASRLRRRCLRPRGMPGCTHP